MIADLHPDRGSPEVALATDGWSRLLGLASADQASSAPSDWVERFTSDLISPYLEALSLGLSAHSGLPTWARPLVSMLPLLLHERIVLERLLAARAGAWTDAYRRADARLSNRGPAPLTGSPADMPFLPGGAQPPLGQAELSLDPELLQAVLHASAEELAAADLLSFTTLELDPFPSLGSDAASSPDTAAGPASPVLTALSRFLTATPLARSLEARADLDELLPPATPGRLAERLSRAEQRRLQDTVSGQLPTSQPKGTPEEPLASTLPALTSPFEAPVMPRVTPTGFTSAADFLSDAAAPGFDWTDRLYTELYAPLMGAQAPATDGQPRPVAQASQPEPLARALPLLVDEQGILARVAAYREGLLPSDPLQAALLAQAERSVRDARPLPSVGSWEAPDAPRGPLAQARLETGTPFRPSLSEDGQVEVGPQAVVPPFSLASQAVLNTLLSSWPEGQVTQPSGILAPQALEQGSLGRPVTRQEQLALAAEARGLSGLVLDEAGEASMPGISTGSWVDNLYRSVYGSLFLAEEAAPAAELPRQAPSARVEPLSGALPLLMDEKGLLQALVSYREGLLETDALQERLPSRRAEPAAVTPAYRAAPGEETPAARTLLTGTPLAQETPSGLPRGEGAVWGLGPARSLAALPATEQPTTSLPLPRWAEEVTTSPIRPALLPGTPEDALTTLLARWPEGEATARPQAGVLEPESLARGAMAREARAEEGPFSQPLQAEAWGFLTALSLSSLPAGRSSVEALEGARPALRTAEEVAAAGLSDTAAGPAVVPLRLSGPNPVLSAEVLQALLTGTPLPADEGAPLLRQVVESLDRPALPTGTVTRRPALETELSSRQALSLVEQLTVALESAGRLPAAEAEAIWARLEARGTLTEDGRTVPTGEGLALTDELTPRAVPTLSGTEALLPRLAGLSQPLSLDQAPLLAGAVRGEVETEAGRPVWPTMPESPVSGPRAPSSVSAPERTLAQLTGLAQALSPELVRLLTAGVPVESALAEVAAPGSRLAGMQLPASILRTELALEEASLPGARLGGMVAEDATPRAPLMLGTSSVLLPTMVELTPGLTVAEAGLVSLGASPWVAESLLASGLQPAAAEESVFQTQRYVAPAPVETVLLSGKPLAALEEPTDAMLPRRLGRLSESEARIPGLPPVTPFQAPPVDAQGRPLPLEEALTRQLLLSQASPEALEAAARAGLLPGLDTVQAPAGLGFQPLETPTVGLAFAPYPIIDLESVVGGYLPGRPASVEEAVAGRTLSPVQEALLTRSQQRVLAADGETLPDAGPAALLTLEALVGSPVLAAGWPTLLSAGVAAQVAAMLAEQPELAPILSRARGTLEASRAPLPWLPVGLSPELAATVQWPMGEEAALRQAPGVSVSAEVSAQRPGPVPFGLPELVLLHEAPRTTEQGDDAVVGMMPAALGKLEAAGPSAKPLSFPAPEAPLQLLQAVAPLESPIGLLQASRALEADLERAFLLSAGMSPEEVELRLAQSAAPEDSPFAAPLGTLVTGAVDLDDAQRTVPGGVVSPELGPVLVRPSGLDDVLAPEVLALTAAGLSWPEAVSIYRGQPWQVPSEALSRVLRADVQAAEGEVPSLRRRLEVPRDALRTEPRAAAGEEAPTVRPLTAWRDIVPPEQLIRLSGGPGSIWEQLVGGAESPFWTADEAVAAGLPRDAEAPLPVAGRTPGAAYLSSTLGPMLRGMAPELAMSLLNALGGVGAVDDQGLGELAGSLRGLPGELGLSSLGMPILGAPAELSEGVPVQARGPLGEMPEAVQPLVGTTEMEGLVPGGMKALMSQVVSERTASRSPERLTDSMSSSLERLIRSVEQRTGVVLPGSSAPVEVDALPVPGSRPTYGDDALRFEIVGQGSREEEIVSPRQVVRPSLGESTLRPLMPSRADGQGAPQVDQVMGQRESEAAESLASMLRKTWGLDTGRSALSSTDQPLGQVLLTAEPVAKDVTGAAQGVYMAEAEGAASASSAASSKEGEKGPDGGAKVDPKSLEEVVSELRWRLSLHARWDSERD